MDKLQLNNVIRIELGSNVTVAEMEMVHIIKVLRKVNFNKSKAIKILGIHANTLRNKLKKYDEDPKLNYLLAEEEAYE